MKIGVFDSGLGGLFILKSIIKKLPQYDYLFLGDTKRLPYGEKSQEQIFEFTKEAVDYLFNHDCELIIIACNTASSQALRRIQQEYLPAHYPKRRVLGVVVPTLEILTKNSSVKKVGIIATPATVKSNAYLKELYKLNPDIEVYQQEAPLLVPLIEAHQLNNINEILKKYLQPLINHKIDALVLACTHYCAIKDQIKKILNKNAIVISQDDFIADKLLNYLKRHTEIDRKLTKNHTKTFNTTKKSPEFEYAAKKWFGENIVIIEVEYPLLTSLQQQFRAAPHHGA